MKPNLLSRRSFLRGSVAAAGSLTLAAAAPSPLAGAETRRSEKSIRWGVIGAGNRGRVVHLPAINAFEDMEALAICDTDEAHLAKGIAIAGGTPQGYRDYQKLLANPNINAVLIATPNCFHHEMVLAALQAGKHVMCEKPMAVDFGQCLSMKKAQLASNRVVLYTMQLRYSNYYKQLRRHIAAGKIGRPRHLIFAEHRGDWATGDIWYYTDPKTGKKINWRHLYAISGGTLAEKVCHYFDILHWMVDSLPERVMCKGGIATYRDGRETWDHSSTVLTYADGCVATHDLCMFGPNRMDLQVIGDEGSIHAVGNSLVFATRGRGRREELPVNQEIRHGTTGPARGHETAVIRMYEDFSACVSTDKQPEITVDMAMAATKTGWLGERAGEQGRELKWSDIG